MPREKLIQLRRGTTLQWATVNPILDSGEAGLETDTNKLKFGDGVTDWNNLPYFSGEASTIIIDSLPFELIKNKSIPNTVEGTLQIGDIIKGFEPTGEYIQAKYLGGDETDFFNEAVYKIYTGI